MKDICVAAVIFHSPLGRLRDNLGRMSSRIRDAKKNGADIVCFPEMNLTGYSIDPAIAGVAESIPGPATRELSRLSRENDIVILAGMAEKSGSGQIFASHLVIQPDGNIGVYRKLHVAPPERAVFTAGSGIPLFTVRGVRFGIQLCYDTHFPDLSTCMALKGVDLIFMPHASPKGVPEEKYNSWMRHLPARAYDNGIFIIACNQTGSNESGLDFPGIALAIGPSGDILSRDISGYETVLIAHLKGSELNHVRQHPMRYFLPNRRLDIFQMR